MNGEIQNHLPEKKDIVGEAHNKLQQFRSEFEQGTENWRDIVKQQSTEKSLERNQLVALHKVLYGGGKINLDDKWNIAKVLLDSYDIQEKNLIAYRRTPEGENKYKEHYSSTHALREMYARALKDLQKAAFEKLENRDISLKEMAFVPARILNYLADKYYKDVGIAAFDVSRMGSHDHAALPKWASQNPGSYALLKMASNTFLDPRAYLLSYLSKLGMIAKTATLGSKAAIPLVETTPVAIKFKDLQLKLFNVGSSVLNRYFAPVEAKIMEDFGNEFHDFKYTNDKDLRIRLYNFMNKTFDIFKQHIIADIRVADPSIPNKLIEEVVHSLKLGSL